MAGLPELPHGWKLECDFEQALIVSHKDGRQAKITYLHGMSCFKKTMCISTPLEVAEYLLAHWKSKERLATSATRYAAPVAVVEEGRAVQMWMTLTKYIQDLRLESELPYLTREEIYPEPVGSVRHG